MFFRLPVVVVHGCLGDGIVGVHRRARQSLALVRVLAPLVQPVKCQVFFQLDQDGCNLQQSLRYSRFCNKYLCTPVMVSSTMPLHMLASVGNFLSRTCVMSPPSSNTRFGCHESPPLRQLQSKRCLSEPSPNHAMLDRNKSDFIVQIGDS